LLTVRQSYHNRVMRSTSIATGEKLAPTGNLSPSPWNRTSLD
jgi:hypothetical protein